MRIKLALIVPAILALLSGASIAAGSTVPLAVAHTSSAHVLADSPDYLYGT
jgi:hypothetical protein